MHYGYRERFQLKKITKTNFSNTTSNANNGKKQKQNIIILNPIAIVKLMNSIGSLSMAMEMLLVTTSNYGSDAYKFVKGKPLTLMNGSNLLYLLKKHGYKARINIKEAKEFLNSQNT